MALGDTPEPSRAVATWRDLDTLALVRQLELALPYTPAGSISGRGVVTWTKWSPEAVQLNLETEITSRAHEAHAGIVPLGGIARLETSDGQWVAELDDVTAPGFSVRGRVEGQLPPGDLPLADTTLEGAVIVVASDLALVASVFELPRLMGDTATGVSGVATVELALDGTVASPSVHGRITDARIGYRGVADIDLGSVFIANQDGVSFTQLAAALGPN